MSPPQLFDPWLEKDDRWAPHELQATDNLCQPDLTPVTLRGFLRSKDARELLPPQPQPNPLPEYDGPRLPHIHGF